MVPLCQDDVWCKRYQDPEVWRVPTTTDVGNVAQGQGEGGQGGGCGGRARLKGVGGGWPLETSETQIGMYIGPKAAQKGLPLLRSQVQLPQRPCPARRRCRRPPRVRGRAGGAGAAAALAVTVRVGVLAVAVVHLPQEPLAARSLVRLPGP